MEHSVIYIFLPFIYLLREGSACPSSLKENPFFILLFWLLLCVLHFSDDASQEKGKLYSLFKCMLYLGFIIDHVNLYYSFWEGNVCLLIIMFYFSLRILYSGSKTHIDASTVMSLGRDTVIPVCHHSKGSIHQTAFICVSFKEWNKRSSYCKLKQLPNENIRKNSTILSVGFSTISRINCTHKIKVFHSGGFKQWKVY